MGKSNLDTHFTREDNTSLVEIAVSQLRAGSSPLDQGLESFLDQVGDTDPKRRELAHKFEIAVSASLSRERSDLLRILERTARERLARLVLN
jgi:hypothetical protein